MGHWSTHAVRGGLLTLVLLLGALVPGAGVVSGQSLGSPAMTATAEEYPDEPPGLIANHAARGPQPTPTPAEAPTPEPKQLTLGELGYQKAPVPAGPSVYVPILLYHYIRVNPIARDKVGFGLSTTPAQFGSQMQYLADQGFHVISLHQAVVAIQNHSTLPARSVVLTFDDGYTDFFTEAVPVMRRYGFTATDFVISGRMGQWSFMTTAQVQAADVMGFTIGAHTVDHVALAAVTPARALWEMRQSKLTLEALLGHPVADFAYPYGSFNNSTAMQAKSLGFETAVSTLSGTVHSKGQLMFLSRIRIGGGMSLAYFAHLVGGPTPSTRASSSSAPMPTPSATPSPAATPRAPASPARLPSN